MVDQIHDKRTYGVMGPRGDTPTVTVLTPTDVLNPNQNPSVKNDGDDLNVVLHFRLPRAPKIVNVTATDGDKAAVKQTVDANGDSSFAFTLPKGPKGDPGPKGETGESLPKGGTAGDVLIKTSTGAEWGDGRDKRIYTNDGKNVVVPTGITRGTMPSGGTGDQNRSLAVGIGAQAASGSTSGTATAIGNYAVTTGSGVAIGDSATSSGGLAIGTSSSSSSSGGLVIGSSASVSGEGSIAVGSGSKVTGASTVAIGTPVFSTASYAVLIGANANNPADRTIVIGNSASAESSSASNSVCIGSAAICYDAYAVAIGQSARGHGVGSVSIGYDAGTSLADSKSSVSIGYEAMGYGNYTVTIGREPNAYGDGAVAIGKYAGYIQADAQPSSTDALVAADSVAIGTESCVSLGSNEVSVGHEVGKGYYIYYPPTGGKVVSSRNYRTTLYRRITNVGTPTKDHDAATKEYVDSFLPTVIETGVVFDNSDVLKAHETKTNVAPIHYQLDLTEYGCVLIYFEFGPNVGNTDPTFLSNIRASVELFQIRDSAGKVTPYMRYTYTNNNDTSVVLGFGTQIVIKLAKLKKVNS